MHIMLSILPPKQLLPPAISFQSFCNRPNNMSHTCGASSPAHFLDFLLLLLPSSAAVLYGSLPHHTALLLGTTPQALLHSTFVTPPPAVHLDLSLTHPAYRCCCTAEAVAAEPGCCCTADSSIHPLQHAQMAECRVGAAGGCCCWLPAAAAAAAGKWPRAVL